MLSNVTGNNTSLVSKLGVGCVQKKNPLGMTQRDSD